MINGVSGRGPDRLCCIEFADGMGKHSVSLGRGNYCNIGAYNRGRWFLLTPQCNSTGLCEGHNDESEEEAFIDDLLQYVDEDGNVL